MNTELAVAAFAGKQIGDFIKAIAPKALDQLDSAMAGGIESYRAKRTLNYLLAAKNECARLGINPRAVPAKLLCPLIENASLEELFADPLPDEKSPPAGSLQAKWVALLVNAANPNFKEEVRSDFVAALAQLSAKDAAIIDYLDARLANCIAVDDWSGTGLQLAELREACRFTMDEFYFATENLLRLRLAAKPDGGTFKNAISGRISVGPPKDAFCITVYGHRFVSACRMPS